ncbi:MAG: T9SS C-terminal target domain-containing protein, partial [Bacteroidota bacterium]
MKISWLILFFIFIGKVYSQAPSIEWQRYIGGSKGQNVWSIQLTHDYGYILSGTTLSNDGD